MKMKPAYYAFYAYSPEMLNWVSERLKDEEWIEMICLGGDYFYELLYALDNHLIECDMRFAGMLERGCPIIEISNVKFFGKALAEVL